MLLTTAACAADTAATCTKSEAENTIPAVRATADAAPISLLVAFIGLSYLVFS
jgi:hypothetical protein